MTSKPKPAAKRAPARKPAAKPKPAAAAPRRPARATPVRELDLDAITAKARAEVDQEPVVVRFRGSEFTLPAELPIDFAIGAGQADMGRVLGALFGDEVDAFLDLKPSVNDIQALIANVGDVYGITPGE